MPKSSIFPGQTGSSGGRSRWLAGLVSLIVAYGQFAGHGPGGRSAVSADEPAPAEAAAEPEGPKPEAPAEQPVEELELETSDGVVLAAWHYPANAAGGPGTGVSVILLHDHGSSHKGVEPLARALQGIGCTVIAPDLRGHGASRTRRVGDRDVKLDVKQFKGTDIEMMAFGRGGRVRDQGLHRGDVETTRNWMVAHGIPMDRLYVGGVGLGAALAAAWAADDASWPDTVAGPQGKQVRGVVMISPTPALQGFSLVKPLEQEAIKREIPILLLGGRSDKDADKLFDQFKRHRPQSWFRMPVSGKPERADKLDDASKATVFQIAVDRPLDGEKLSADGGVTKAVERFLDLTKPAAPKRR